MLLLLNYNFTTVINHDRNILYRESFVNGIGTHRLRVTAWRTFRGPQSHLAALLIFSQYLQLNPNLATFAFKWFWQTVLSSFSSPHSSLITLAIYEVSLHNSVCHSYLSQLLLTHKTRDSPRDSTKSWKPRIHPEGPVDFTFLLTLSWIQFYLTQWAGHQDQSHSRLVLPIFFLPHFLRLYYSIPPTGYTF